MIPDHLIIEAIQATGQSFPIKLPLILSQGDLLMLKVVAYLNQEGLCICKEILNEGDLHHALISKKDAMGFVDNSFINDSRNVLLLHHCCHINITRERSYEFLSNIFGNMVDDWYNSIEFKSTFRKLPS